MIEELGWFGLLIAGAVLIVGWILVARLRHRSRQADRRAAEEADRRLATAEAERQRLEAVVDAMSEGVLVTDAEGKVSLANPQWKKLFGLVGGVEGVPVHELGHRAVLSRMVTATLEDEERRQVGLELSSHPAETLKTLVLKSAPLADSGGAVVVAEDVTELLHLSEVRRDFVANVSHELKTPLSAIRGFAETLTDGAKDDPKVAKRFLKRILKQCTRLEALLADLLTLSRLEHSPEESRLAPVDFGRVVSEAVEDLADRVAKRKLHLETDLRPVVKIEGDTLALERLCENLLANAVKYNRSGGQIRVRLFGSARDIVLEVEDTGIGIPAESIDRLFERFYRVDKGRSRKEGGTGLGLAIVKHAANLHGGTVEVESELGRGSLFRVRLPSLEGTTTHSESTDG